MLAVFRSHALGLALIIVALVSVMQCAVTTPPEPTTHEGWLRARASD